MNQKQKSIITNFVAVICCTLLFVVIMANVKDVINKSEAMRTMEILGQHVQAYREKTLSSPPESFIISQQQSLNDVRLGEITYRAQWLGYKAKASDILAYSEKNYGLLAGNGSIVMFLDGSVKWMEKSEFRELLNQQQSAAEWELLQKDLGMP